MFPPLRCLLVFVVTLIASSSAFSKTWIVDSSPDHVADFKTVQDAHDGAAEGDILYLMGSFRHYGDLIATKRLTYIGPGYFLDENFTEFRNTFPARLKSVSLRYEISNSEFDDVNPEEITSDSSGSVFQGVTVETELHIIANDIVVKGCKINYLHISKTAGSFPAGGADKRDVVSACLFVQSYFTGSTYIQMNCTDVFFRNSIFKGTSLSIGTRNTNASAFISSTELENNIFDGSSFDFSDCRIRNNIFTEVSSFRLDDSTATGNVFNSNKWAVNAQASYKDPLDEDTNTGLFEDAILALFDGEGSDGQYLPAAENTDLLNGVDGAMVGPFGGSYPYVLSGLPNIPRIVGVDAPPTGPSQGSIPITLKIRLPQ